LSCIVASDLLAKQIKAGFSQHPFGEGIIQIILPPRSSSDQLAQRLAFLDLLGTMHSIPHGQTHSSTFLFQQGPTEQEHSDRRLGRRHRLTSQALSLEQLLDAFEKKLNVPTCLI